MNDSLDRDPVVLLYDVARIMRTKFDQRARAREMTRAQWHILARVDRQPGLSQSELATICEVEPITVARLIDRLEKRGLLERRHDPNDRRIWRLYNLPAALPILEEITAYREELIRDIDKNIGPAAREAMVNALLAVRAQFSAMPETPGPRRGADTQKAPQTNAADETSQPPVTRSRRLKATRH